MNILIADSGSTKTDWAVVAQGPERPAVVRTCTTQGLNPLYTTPEVIAETLRGVLQTLAQPVGAVQFYGSGCAGERIGQMQAALRRALPAGTGVEVMSDVVGAARALYPPASPTAGGIACIMGTGAIAARYTKPTPSASEQVETASSLGYILGDEGSGVWLGRQVLADYLKEQMPAALRRDFEDEFGPISALSAIEHVYRLPFPNRYLASFAIFVGRHLESDYCHSLAFAGAELFVKRNVARLRPRQDEPVAFVGSVADGLRTVLAQVAALHGFTLGPILKSPLLALATA